MLRTVGAREKRADVVSHSEEHFVQVHPFLGVSLFRVLAQRQRMEQRPQRTRVASIVRLGAFAGRPTGEFRFEVIVVLLQVVQIVVNVELLLFALEKLVQAVDELGELGVVGGEVSFDDVEEPLQDVQLAAVERFLERNLVVKRVADRTVQIADV